MVVQVTSKDFQEDDIMNFNDLHYHFHAARVSSSSAALPGEDETLVADARAGLTPAQMVDRKLASLLESTAVRSDRPQSARPARSQKAPGRFGK
jgi:hypothetical protein